MTTPSPWGTRAFVAHTMGMAVSLHVRALAADLDARGDELAAAVERAFDALRRADDVFSTYRADSQLMRIRRGALEAAHADPWFAEVRRLCEEAEAVSGGLFTTDLVGPDGTRGFDPTGLVKGFAVERAADVLRQVSGIVFCLNAGGDMVADEGRGPRTTRGTDATPRTPEGAPDARIPRTWNIGVADPRDPSAVLTVVPLTHGALATSGTAQRGEHIVDPRDAASETGAEAASTDATRGPGLPRWSPTSVTVSGPDLVWADVWATVSFLDPDVLAFSRMAASYAVVHVAR